MVSLTFYDGVNCIGGNKILLESDDTALLMDFGLNFGAEGRYFDEFLNGRLIFGISDYLALGLLPPLKGLYRPDLELPGVWDGHKKHRLFRELEVNGLLLSHAHVDHNGYLPYLKRDIPIYSSLTTAFITKVMQDTKGGNAFQETCYIVNKKGVDGQLQSQKDRKIPYEQRPFFAMDSEGYLESQAAFWGRCDGKRSLNSCPMGTCSYHETKIGNLNVCWWPVDHSIPGAGAFGVETLSGWVIYTGDLRLHGKNAHNTRDFMKAAAELHPLALICEGTHPETEKPVTEDEVFENSLAVVSSAKGRLIIADFGPRNIDRLISFLEIARETNRQLVLTYKDVYLLDALHDAGEPGVPDPFTDGHFVLYNRPKGLFASWEKSLIDKYKLLCPERLVNSQEIQREPGRFILCFSYYDFPALLDIAPEKAVYIYSSSEAYNEEMMIDHNRVKNWIDFFGMELYGGLGEDREKSGFHASGHIHGPGLMELVETINPQVLIPVHSEDRSFFERHFGGKLKLLLPGPGETIKL
jgi:ribonuclease J